MMKHLLTCIYFEGTELRVGHQSWCYVYTDAIIGCRLSVQVGYTSNTPSVTPRWSESLSVTAVPRRDLEAERYGGT